MYLQQPEETQGFEQWRVRGIESAAFGRPSN